MLYIDNIVVNILLLTLLLHCIGVVHVVCYKYDVLLITSGVSLLFDFLYSYLY